MTVDPFAKTALACVLFAAGEYGDYLLEAFFDGSANLAHLLDHAIWALVVLGLLYLFSKPTEERLGTQRRNRHE